MSSISIFWEYENVVFFEFTEYWRVDDLFLAIESSKQVFRKADGLVDVILDMRQVSSVPGNLVELKNYLCSLSNRHIGMVILVTRNRRLRDVSVLLSKLMRSHFMFQFADSTDHAYQLIQRATATRGASAVS